MATLTLALSVKQSRLEHLASLVNEAATEQDPATLTFYAAPQPAAPEEALDGQIELAVVAVPVPFEADITNAVLTAAAFEEVLATGDGIATWARLRDSAGTPIADLTVGMEGEGANITITQTQFYQGVIVDVESLTIAEA